MYRLYHFASLVLPYLPRSFVKALARVIGFIAWLVAVRTRKQATVNLRHVFGNAIQDTKAGRRMLRKTVRRMFQNNARNYLDVFSFPRMTQDKLWEVMRNISGDQHLEEALALGKGIVIVSAHIGPFNFLIKWFSAKGYEVIIPVEHLKDERMLELMLKLREAKGVQFLPLGGSMPLRSMIQALHQNKVVLITGDRAIVGESVEKPFFGAKARLPIGPITLAKRTGAAIVGAFGWYESSNSIGGRFFPVSLALPEQERGDEEALHSKVVEVMEEAIKLHPEQWLVFSPVWVD